MQGYEILDNSSAEFGQVQAQAAVFLEEEGAFEAGQFEIVEVFDIGGDRYPMINESLDFLAFFHEPHFVLAEAAPLVQVREEPGRAPVPPTIDEDSQRQYVYMVRDLGARRQPAMVLTIGGGAIFLALCYLLHRREKFLRANLAMPTTPVVGTQPRLRNQRPNQRRKPFRSDHGPVPADRGVDDPGRVVRRDQLRRLASAGTQPAVVGQGSTVRVRHRAVA